MTNNFMPSATKDKLNLLKQPGNNHLVQFYKSDDKLLAPLTQYIRTGLSNGETCIVIATAAHIESLNQRLDAAGQDVLAAQINGQYLTYDASETLSLFMVDGQLDKSLYFSTIGNIVKRAADQGKPIRAYGEMVALLWKTGNKVAVIQLENLWNELADIHAFSLYCAYPELHFIMDRSSQDEIVGHHSVNFASSSSVTR